MPVLHNEVLTPVLLNAQQNPLPGFPYTDNMGEHISEKNGMYCELTALYMLWKNNVWADADYIGLFHYRRVLSLNEQLNDGLPDYDLFEINEVNDEYAKYGLTKQKIDQHMKNFDVLLPRPKVFSDCVYDQYAQSKDHHIEHVEYALKYIRNDAADYEDAAQKVFKGKQVSLYNMFVMNASLFRQYCDWLFPLLQYVESNVNVSFFNTQELRYIGFLTERLFNVFLEHQQTVKKLKIAYFPVFQSNYEQPSSELEQLLNTTNDVVIFGTGIYASKMLNMINNPIVCFVDNNSELHSFADKNVFTPQKYEQQFGKSYPILICSSYYQEIAQQLSSMGYEKSKDFFKLDTSYFIEQLVTT